MNSIASTTAFSAAAQKIIAAYAMRHSIEPAQLPEFLNPKLNLDHYLLPDAERVVERLKRAAEKQEHILVFGDYDADGITSTAILLRFARECLSLSLDWALPNRQVDHYGLDLDKAEKLFTKHKPSLLICLDCGTNSTEAIEWLKQRGTDTIVVDHHPIETSSSDAFALVNPKVHYGCTEDLKDLCAAGLTLLLCNHLARALGKSGNWDRAAATMLAGVGTIADSVAMTRLNRAMAKTALTLINTPENLNRVAGLSALALRKADRFNQRRLQFEIIPALNALGRLDSADPGVSLLTTTDPFEARIVAARCHASNEVRKAKQSEMIEQASITARSLIANHPDAKVLVLADHRWHHGVAGPAASQIAEAFGRSTILLAPNGSNGQWKGSGRSCDGDDLGAWIRNLKTTDLIQRGGGHAAAVGLAARSDQLALLQSAGLTLPIPQAAGHQPETEIIGEIDDLAFEEWVRVIELMEPFGQGNPFPTILVRQARCTTAPAALTVPASGEVWGVKAEFLTPRGKALGPVWRDCSSALRQWRPGKRFDLELSVTARAHRGRQYYNWSVLRCTDSYPSQSTNRKNEP